MSLSKNHCFQQQRVKQLCLLVSNNTAFRSHALDRNPLLYVHKYVQ